MIKVNEYEIYRTIEDLPVKTVCFAPEKAVVVKGVIQILHGMCEHKERYFDFIKYLNEQGYICVINDMRGHGENVGFFTELGYFGEDGHKLLIRDTHAVTVYIKNNFPDLPVILLAHSMGTLVARAVLKQYDDDYDKVVLLGSPSNRFGKGFALFLAEVLGLVRDEKKTSNLLDILIMGLYSMKYKNEKEKYSWICSDLDVVREYSENMYCNFSFTINGYITLLNIMKMVYSKNKWRMKNRRLPIIFMSGNDDPCMIDEKAFNKSIEYLKEAGYMHVEGKIYEGMRHEILNEKDKLLVYKDIVEWLKDDEEDIQEYLNNMV